MKKLFVRITSVALVLLLLFAVSGCASKKEDTVPDFAWDGTGEEMYQYAVEHGFVVCEDNHVVKNLSVWLDSYKRILQGKETTVYLAHFLKKSEEKVDYILQSVSVLFYDGEKFGYSKYCDEEILMQGTYLYLHNLPFYSRFQNLYYEDFFLTNQEVYTNEAEKFIPGETELLNIPVCSYSYDLPDDMY